MEWMYDKRTETQTIGNTTDGCGLFKDGMFWYGNVVIKGEVVKNIWPTEREDVAIMLDKFTGTFAFKHKRTG